MIHSSHLLKWLLACTHCSFTRLETLNYCIAWSTACVAFIALQWFGDMAFAFWSCFMRIDCASRLDNLAWWVHKANITTTFEESSPSGRPSLFTLLMLIIHMCVCVRVPRFMPRSRAPNGRGVGPHCSRWASRGACCVTWFDLNSPSRTRNYANTTSWIQNMCSDMCSELVGVIPTQAWDRLLAKSIYI